MHLPGYAIAPFAPADEAALQAMLEADPAYFTMIQGVAAGPDEARSLAADLPPGHSPDDKFLFVIRDSFQRLCAAVELLRGYPEPPIWFLGLIFVAPFARDRGLGTRLLNAVCDHAREQGGEALRLGVVQPNTRARALYDRNGFRFLVTRGRKSPSGFRVPIDVLERPL